MSKHQALRNIVFFGETGTGKSSAINLILGSNKLGVSNDAHPCTQQNACYEVVLHGEFYNLWDTRGLGAARGFFRSIFFGEASKKYLEKFLRQRHEKQEIDLLVFCVHGSRVTKASAKYYKNFCVITRRMAAPVAIMVTQLEKELDMEGWWIRNSSRLKDFNMEFDDHICVTTLATHPRSAESKKRLVDLITKDRRWETKETGSYFGSRVPRPAPSLQSQRGTERNLFKSMHKNTTESGHATLRHNSATASLAGGSSYHTPTESPIEPTPSHCTSALERTPRITTDLNLLGSNHRSQPSSGDTSGTGSPSPSMFYLKPGSQSSHTSRSETHEPCSEEHIDHSNELPPEFPADCVQRTKTYATKSGAFADIWQCNLISPGKPSYTVAVKAIKTTSNQDLESLKKKLHREWKVWGKLRHKNIVPLLGVVRGFGPLLSMVSPWLCNGTLTRFLKHQTLGTSEKYRLLRDVAAGLSYLHSQNVIHGDLHSDNILIDEDKTACLTDFGLSFVNEFVGTAYLKSSICGGVQFADPALVRRANNESPQEVIYPTKPCDVYSFGGIMLHITSGKKPYDGMSQMNIFSMVLKGERSQITNDPPIPPWQVSEIRKCWDEEENKRPSAEDLVKMFHRYLGSCS